MKLLYIISLIQGSSTDIIAFTDKVTLAVSDIKGNIYLYDRRNPLQQIAKVKAGNTVHKLWASDSLLTAACEDGNLRAFDLKIIR